MKIIYTSLFCLAILLTGCSYNPFIVKDDLEYKQDEFSIKLPALYVIKDNDVISPINEDSFPAITFYSVATESEPSSEIIQNMEAEKIGSLCAQTESCPQIINYENFSFAGQNGIKQTTKYQGRSIDVSEGYIMGYTYIVYSKGKLYYFSTSASDLETPDKVNQDFSKIMETVKFK